MTDLATGVRRAPDSGAPSGFTRAAVESLSDRRDEPAWLRERRLAAFETFERLPIPTRQDEDYRRTDLRRLRLERFTLSTGTPASAPTSLEAWPADVRELMVESGQGPTDSGALIALDGAPVASRTAPDLADGVIFCTLDEAVRTHPDLVRRYLTDERIGADEDKWSAMNSAFWTGGVFIYVPSGVTLELPLRTVTARSGAGPASFARMIIVAEEWSQVTVVADYLSLGRAEGEAFNASVVDVVAGEGSVVRYCHLQNWGTDVWNFERERFFGHRDAAINVLQVGLGSKLTKAYVQAHIDEPGVSVELLGLVFIGGAQHIDHTTLQNHRAGQSMSDLLFKCAMLEEARSVYGGLIAIEPGAQRSDAYQNNRNLLLSGAARADSIPMLEIKANDVRCTHGSTTSSVDEEELFYLQSRGLPRGEAERVIVEGFFSPVIDRVPVAGVKERLAREIETQIGKLSFDG